MWTQKILNRAQLGELLTEMNVTYDSVSTGSSVSPMDGSRLFTVLAYCSLFLVGLGGNAWVAYVIAHVLGQRNRESPRCVQVYILALCLGDFVILTFSLFLIMDLLYNAWIIESVLLCRLYLSSESLNKFYVPFVLVSLSYFCYSKICRPHGAEKLRSNYFLKIFGSIKLGSTKSAVISISLCAVIAFVLCIPVYAYGDMHYLVFDEVINDTDQGAESIDKRSRMMIMPKCAFSPPEFLFNSFIVYSFVSGFAIPASLFTYFYSAILWHSRRRQRESIARLGVGGSNHKAQGHKSQFWRVAKTASGLVSFYLFCWLPFWMTNLYHAWSPSQQESRDQDDDTPSSDFAVVFGYFIHMLPYINCTGYPILYTLLNRQILNAYRNSAKARYQSRQSITRASTGYLGDNIISARAGRSRRHGSGNSHLLHANSCTSINKKSGEIETNLLPARIVASESDISAM